MEEYEILHGCAFKFDEERLVTALHETPECEAAFTKEVERFLTGLPEGEN